MSASLIKQLLETADSETSAGNYFVSNYPPFSFWKEEENDKVLSILEQPAPKETDLGLYFHTPFCRKRCHFCYFRVYTEKSAAEIQQYLESVLKELERYAAKPYLQGRKPSFIYFGGGTPSYLSVKQLTFWTENMKKIIPWDQAQEIAFEGEPGTLNPIKLQALRDIGVTRLSLGIENFDDRILEINGRAHRSKEVFRAFEAARKSGFPQINIDLIAGMLEETEENWKSCIERAIELDPDSVTIYQMEVPYNTTIYKRMKEEGTLTAPIANWKTKREWVKWAFRRFEQAGYTVTSAYTVVKNPEKSRFLYRDKLWTGADLISCGVASFSYLGGVHFQNAPHIEAYEKQIAEGSFPVSRALETTEEERMLREFILQMKLGRVQFPYFQNKFSVDLHQRFHSEFTYLIDQNLATLSDGTLTLSDDALLRVDALLHAFFMEKHRTTRLV